MRWPDRVCIHVQELQTLSFKWMEMVKQPVFHGNDLESSK